MPSHLNRKKKNATGKKKLRRKKPSRFSENGNVQRNSGPGLGPGPRAREAAIEFCLARSVETFNVRLRNKLLWGNITLALADTLTESGVAPRASGPGREADADLSTSPPDPVWSGL